MRSAIVATKRPTLKLHRPRGTSDFTPAETEKSYIENRMRSTAENWVYEELKPTHIGHTELFTIKSGEAILRELYVFKDGGGKEIVPHHTHRPWLSEISGRSTRIILRGCYHVE